MKEERRQRFVAQLEKLGVGEVKQRIVKGSYGDPWKNIAQAWVEQKEASSSAEQLSLARQAKWLAIAALVIAAISMIIAAFSLGVSGVFR
jgi:RNase P/RNase MRP subunit POP5